VPATCEMKTIMLREPVEFDRRGINPSDKSVAAAVIKPIKYQRRAVSVKSATGPQTNRQRLAETPKATMKLVVATENPARVRMKPKVIEANPELMPEGMTRKKNVNGAVDCRSRISITSNAFHKRRSHAEDL
jgi:hypothetical protein